MTLYLTPLTKVLSCLLFFALLGLTGCVESKHAVQVSNVVSFDTKTAASVPADLKRQAPAPVVREHWGKKAFFQFMKPIVEQENKRVLQERARLLTWRKHKAFDVHVLKQIAQRYRVPWTGKVDGGFWRSLLDRVDEIPMDLVLIQAANESSWGNSRFARQANNYFGQWCFRKGCGLVPLRRNAGATHEVQYFKSAELSVRSYIHNLNSSPSYKLLRNMRHSLRRQGKPLDAEFLAIGLKDYSERGMDYVHNIQAMIRSNKKLIEAL